MEQSPEETLRRQNREIREGNKELAALIYNITTEMELDENGRFDYRDLSGLIVKMQREKTNLLLGSRKIFPMYICEGTPFSMPLHFYMKDLQERRAINVYPSKIAADLYPKDPSLFYSSPDKLTYIDILGNLQNLKILFEKISGDKHNLINSIVKAIGKDSFKEHIPLSWAVCSTFKEKRKYIDEDPSLQDFDELVLPNLPNHSSNP